MNPRPVLADIDRVDWSRFANLARDNARELCRIKDDVWTEDSPLAQLGKLGEECGEVAGAIIKRKSDGELAGELCDVILVALSIAGICGMDLGPALSQKLWAADALIGVEATR